MSVKCGRWCAVVLAAGMAVFAAQAAAAENSAPAAKWYGAFREAPLSSIQPEGWIRTWLETQRDGLTGHLENGGFPFDTIGWDGPRLKNAPDKSIIWNYEQYGYWVDGMIRTGVLLGDDALLAKGRKQTQYVLTHADAEGFLPPPSEDGKGRMYYIPWPHTVLFRAMMADYSVTKDPKIVEALHKNYLATIAAGDFDPKKMNRHLCAIEIMCWLYGLTGDSKLLDESKRMLDANGFIKRLANDKPASGHGVTYNEMAKLPAIVYLYTGDKKLLNMSVKGMEKLKEDMLIDGSPSAAEHLIGNDARAGHETCDITDFSWSAGYLLMATGDGSWADKIERATFNAGPGAVTKDFKAHQYFSAPNQVICTHWSNHLPFDKARFAYRPGHDVECCTGGVNRFMPNYVSRMWMTDGAGGVAAAMFGPSRFTTSVGGQSVVIDEKTDYPFSEKIEFAVKTDKPVRFPLYVRIPGWCESPSLTINGAPATEPLKPGTFVKLDRSFAPGDTLVLTLPMTVKITRWPDNGLGVERGPLAYSLDIKENRVVDPTDKRSSKTFPAYDITPASPWNYALDVDLKDGAKSIQVVQGKRSDRPLDTNSGVVALMVPARKVKGWELEKGEVDKKTGKTCQYTPGLPEKVVCEGPVEMVKLVPLGSTCLRLSIFPSARELPPGGPVSKKKGDEFKVKPPTQ